MRSHLARRPEPPGGVSITRSRRSLVPDPDGIIEPEARGLMRNKLTLVALASVAIALSTPVSGRTGGTGAQQASGSAQKPAQAPAQAPEQQAPPAQGGGQPAQQPGQPVPTFKAGINFVRVDVIASTSKGEPVVDLKKEDFVVTEDGKPQTVDSFKLIKLDQNHRHDAPARNQVEFRRRVRGAARGCPSLRDLPR